MPIREDMEDNINAALKAKEEKCADCEKNHPQRYAACQETYKNSD